MVLFPRAIAPVCLPRKPPWCTKPLRLEAHRQSQALHAWNDSVR